MKRSFFVFLCFATLTIQAQNGVVTNEVRTIKGEDMPTRATLTFDVQRIKAMGNSAASSNAAGETQWEVCANTPLSEEMKEQLYPQLHKFLVNFGEKTAVNVLLDWVQSSFRFTSRAKASSNVKRPNRPYYPEEMLYYLQGDSEDFAILFSRIVRDLLGLDVALVNYSSKAEGKTFNHMSTAILFTEEVPGDAVTVGEKRYVIADPTYLGAPVGRTHPHFDNSTAKILLLKR